MNLNKSLMFGAAAMMVVGGSVLAAGAYSFDQETQAQAEAESTSVTTATAKPGVEADNATSATDTKADLGVEQYRGGGRGFGGGAHFGGGRGFGGGAHFGGGRGFGGHGFGRGFGWGGRGWGRSIGYRGGRFGYWGPSYYGYTCADGLFFCY